MWPILGVLINLSYVSCNVIVTPKNTAVIAGERAVLECRTENRSIVREWTFESSLNSRSERRREKVFSNWSHRSVKGNFTAVVDQYGSGFLYLNATRSEDAGIYTCAVEVGRDMVLHSAHLIVLESKPVCAARVSEEYHILVQCSINFSGNWPPKMEWSRQEMDGTYNAGHRITSGIDYFNSTEQVSSTLNAIMYSTKEFFFACKTYFASHIGNATMTATNTPDFVFIWNSSVIGWQSDSKSDTTSDKSGISVFGVSNQDSTSQTTFIWHTNTLFLVGFLLILFLLIIVVVTMYYIHRKSTASGKKDKEVSVEMATDMPIFDGYDIIPYACSGDIEIREEKFNSSTQTGQLCQHQDPLPAQGQSTASVVLSNAANQRGQHETEESVAETAIVHTALEYTNIETKRICLLDDIEINRSVIGVEAEINEAIMPYDFSDVEAMTEEAQFFLEEIPSAYLKMSDENIELVQSKFSPLSGQICMAISTKKPSLDAQTSIYTKLLATE